MPSIMKGLVVVGLAVLVCGVTMVNGEEKIDVDPSLIAYYKFDEDEGSQIKDSSTYGNHGKIIKGATWAAGKHGSGLEFDGVDNNRVEIPHSESFKTLMDKDEVTVEFWIKFKGQSSCFVLYKAENCPRVTLYGNGMVTFGIRSIHPYKKVREKNMVFSKRRIEKDRWHHYAGTFKDGVIKIYIDGKLDAYRKTPFHINVASSAPLMLGDRRTGYNFKGVIDELKIYNRALTVEEIASHMNLGEDLRWE